MNDQATTHDPEPLIAADGLRFAVGQRSIVGPVDIALHRGQVVGLVGPNGSGKSTLVKMLARQIRPSGGSISLLGKPVSDFSDRAFARTVAYMPQFTPPAESMTVRELAALGRFPWHGTLGRFGAQDAAKVEDALVGTDLAAMADRLVDSLSGGERQRAWLAMMLAQDTQCLLLDEPTSALDIAHQVEMLALVRRLSRERGLSVIIVLHDINMAARTCDTILALRDGRLVASGAPDDILEPAVLAGIYGLTMGILPHPVTGRPIGYVP